MSGKSRLLYELMLRKGYPEEFSRLICAEMSTDFTAEKMMSYVSGPKKRLENVADEMVAIQDHNCVIISESGYNTGYKRGRRFSSLEFQRLYASDFFESHVLRHRRLLKYTVVFLVFKLDPNRNKFIVECNCFQSQNRA